jgi:hypothetical protein
LVGLGGPSGVDEADALGLPDEDGDPDVEEVAVSEGWAVGFEESSLQPARPATRSVGMTTVVTSGRDARGVGRRMG